MRESRGSRVEDRAWHRRIFAIFDSRPSTLALPVASDRHRACEQAPRTKEASAARLVQAVVIHESHDSSRIQCNEFMPLCEGRKRTELAGWLSDVAELLLPLMGSGTGG